MTKPEFHYGLFYNACVGFLGKPDYTHNYGYDGHYMWVWHVKLSRREAAEKETALRSWLNIFDVTWVDKNGHICSSVEYSDSPPHLEKPSLKITIHHPVEKPLT